MALTQRIHVELRRKKLITVELKRKKPINVKMFVLDKSRGGASTLVALTDTEIASPQENDVLTYIGGEWVNQPVSGTVDPTNFVQGEIPTPAPPVLATEKFTTANNFVSATLEIFLNGMKLLASDFTIYAPNQFSIQSY